MTPVNLPQKQRGATMILALVMLLIISLLAFSTRESSTLQAKMATAYQQKVLARYAAEAGLKAAENFLRQNINSTAQLGRFSGTNTGLYAGYPYPGEIELPAPSSRDFDDLNNALDWGAINSIEVTNFQGQGAANPRYIIEYSGRNKGASNKVVLDYNDPNLGADSTPHVFTITAIGYARDDRIYQVLQSSFQTGHGPGNFIY